MGLQDQDRQFQYYYNTRVPGKGTEDERIAYYYRQIVEDEKNLYRKTVEDERKAYRQIVEDGKKVYRNVEDENKLYRNFVNDFGLRASHYGSVSSATVKYSKPIFAPKYIPIVYARDHAINAMIEIQALWQYVIDEAYYNYSEVFSKLSYPLKPSVMQEYKNHKENFAVYDTKREIWLIEPSESDYEYCFDGKNFVEFEVAKSKMNNNLLLVGKYTKLMQEPNLVRETIDAPSKFHSFCLPTMKLIVGVPGCGKTTYIVENHCPRSSLVLTSCKEGAQDIRSRMEERSSRNASSPPVFYHRYRTIDSYLLHNKQTDARRKHMHRTRNLSHMNMFNSVWMDEALMEHPGKLFLVCMYSGCSIMHMLGDPNQLGFINRVKDIELRYEESKKLFTPTQTLCTSYRCPVDVMALISHKYTSGAYSTSPVLHSLAWKQFTTLDAIPMSTNTKYLVFKQKEKSMMKKAGYNVSTIHEFQGKQEKNVVIVRMSNNLREELYKSPPHVLVGMTRHTDSLVYYTPVKDSLQKIIQKSITDNELEKHQIKPIATILIIVILKIFSGGIHLVSALFTFFLGIFFTSNNKKITYNLREGPDDVWRQ